MADKARRAALAPAVASLLADAALCLVEISEIQAVSLLMGSRLEIGGKFYQASAGGQLITRQLPNESRTVNKLWEHLRDNHGIDATHLRFDPVGEYQKCWRVRKVATLKNELNHAIRRSWLRRIA